MMLPDLISMDDWLALLFCLMVTVTGIMAAATAIVFLWWQA
jgi:hypothetical protein